MACKKTCFGLDSWESWWLLLALSATAPAIGLAVAAEVAATAEIVLEAALVAAFAGIAIAEVAEE